MSERDDGGSYSVGIVAEGSKGVVEGEGRGKEKGWGWRLPIQRGHRGWSRRIWA